MNRITWMTALGAVAAALAACGGGGGTTTSAGTPATPASASGADAGALSSGSISAFGSVFVNGHEYATGGARVVDDDAGTSSTDVSTLEVGMSVDVKAASDSSASHPVAAEIHLHPLVRGVVDGSDAGAGTLTVMGQVVQLTASTNFSDHRACVVSTSAPCAAITGQSGLSATSGGVPGSYVAVHGFLYAGGPNVVATLVTVNDLPSAPGHVAYKAEGVVTAASGSSVTIGALAVDLTKASCAANGAAVPCAGAYAVGQVVSAVGATAPTLPATAFAADGARLASRMPVQSAGAAIELEGKVSSVSTSPASFVLRGVTVDASALASLPAAGDFVRVAGVVGSGGTTVTANAVTVLHPARSATFGFEGDVAGVAAGSAAQTWTLSLLGQTITVDARTRLGDASQRGVDPTKNPFNIDTFQSYLAASASQHVVVRTEADASGALTALSLVIVPPAPYAGVGGVIDASPAPANGSGGAATSFSVHGLAVVADPSSVVDMVGEHDGHGFGGMVATLVHGIAGNGSVAAGDLVMARGTWVEGTLTVGASSAQTPPPWRTAVVIDYGSGSAGHDHDGF